MGFACDLAGNAQAAVESRIRLRGGILSRSLIEFGQCQKSGIAAELLAQLTLAACHLFHHFAHGAGAAHAGLRRNVRLGHWPLRARRRGFATGMVRGVIGDRLCGCRLADDGRSRDEEYPRRAFCEDEVHVTPIAGPIAYMSLIGIGSALSLGVGSGAGLFPMPFIAWPWAPSGPIWSVGIAPSCMESCMAWPSFI